MAGEPDPHWLRDAARAVAHELRAYFATLFAIATAPRRFATEWAEGRRQALNPLAFQLNALAVLGPWRAVWARLVDPNPPTTPLWFELLKPTLPVIGNAVGVTIIHALVRLFGGKRPLRSSVAMALYISGGPTAVVGFVIAPLVLYGWLHPMTPVALGSAVGNLTLMALLLVYTVKMLSALHGLPSWRVVIGVVVGWMLVGTFWATVSRVHPEMLRSMLSG